MNVLLHQLKVRGAMQRDCIAVATQDQALLVVEIAEQREVFFMGGDVRPGPYWVVHAVDAAGLEKEGYQRGG